MKSCMVRLQGECGIETLQRALMFTEASVQHGAVVMCGRQVRVERNGPLETLQRLALASDGLEGDTKIRVRPWIVQCQTQRLPGVRERLFATSRSCRISASSGVRCSSAS
jgi:hypothetical protein